MARKKGQESTTFVIRTEAGEDLSFIAFSQHEGEWPPAANIDHTDTDMIVRIDLDTRWTFDLRSNENHANWTAIRGDASLWGTGILL